MPNAWLENSERGTGEKVRNQLSATDQANEYLMMGLRISEGIDVARIEALAKQPLNEIALSHLIELGLLKRKGPQLRASSQGRLLLNSVIAELIF